MDKLAQRIEEDAIDSRNGAEIIRNIKNKLTEAAKDKRERRYVDKSASRDFNEISPNRRRTKTSLRA